MDDGVFFVLLTSILQFSLKFKAYRSVHLKSAVNHSHKANAFLLLSSRELAYNLLMIKSH